MTALRLLLVLIFLVTPAHAAKRRSVRAHSGTFTAYPLHAVDLVADTSDLQPLDAIVGNASIIGLGDSTHGTREYYTMRLRLIDYFVRKHGINVVSIEAPFPITERINAYVQGGPGDPRALLAELSDRLLYLFWDVEEFLTVVEWMRAYNVHRGDRPPLEIVGADIYDESGGVAGVLDYLRRTDPGAAADAERDYACVLAGDRGSDCQAAARAIRSALAAKQDGSRALDDAIHYADVVLQFFEGQVFRPREYALAANLIWIRDHRGRVIHWGHQEHVGKLPSTLAHGDTMGTILAQQVGKDYVAIGTLTGSGTFMQWARIGRNLFTEAPLTFPDPAAGTYEWYFRRRGIPAMIIPMPGVPGRSFRTAGTTSGWIDVEQSLAQKLDALIYIDRTTPTRPLR